ncbi:UV damage repair protein UvrX [Solibacillus sp. MA9]|uniref:UV damage repair protein UvrX n=1 Tax=Solibacillus palustris TaxID=2908203 RepID=A0ABS9UE50_9BACL|nr:UV damage repair protein UvrX [Solibacillus sp. MA9]MCH7322419.1 UV damage repair protein UvrX [Solibacillus sp. MA9]
MDMHAFYVSCIASLENIDIMNVPMAVVGSLTQSGSVVLSANRPMKERFKIKTGNRLYEIPKHPDIKLFEPKMEFFIHMSVEIIKLAATFVPIESIHVYSIDEFMLKLDDVTSLYGDAESITKSIQNAIYQQFKIPCSAGMGDNILMAKLALDLEGKKSGFAKWTYEDIPHKLWKVSPLSEMWGIGKQTEKRLNAMGIYTVGGLAEANLDELEKKFGVMGNQLYYHAWGIDLAQIGEQENIKDIKRGLSFGKSQMLMRDYNHKREISVVLLEMCEDVAKRAREKGYSARTISLGLAHSRHAIMSDNFYRSRTVEEPTNDTLVIYNVCKELLNEFYGGEPARQLSVRISNVSKERGMQLDLFDQSKDKRAHLANTMDNLRNRFGSTSILRAVSFTNAGTARSRRQLVAGHKK